MLSLIGTYNQGPRYRCQNSVEGMRDPEAGLASEPEQEDMYPWIPQ